MSTMLLHPLPGSVTASCRRGGKMLQIVHSLKVGGAEILAERFARQLGGPENVVFACLDEPGPEAVRVARDGFVVESLDRRPGFDRRCIRRLSQLYRKHEIGVVHAHQYTPFSYAAMARGVNRRLPILFTEHGRFFPDRTSLRRRLVNRLLLGPNDRILAVGECVKRALVNNEGIAANRIEVVMNGVVPTAVAAGRREQVRRGLGIPDRVFVAIVAARFDPIKDHATALRAWNLVRKDAPDAVLLLAGDGPERSSVVRLIDELNLSEGVRMLGSRQDVPDLLAAADVAMLTSLSEGIPLSLLEAMAAGIPVVATSVGGIPEVVIDGSTGFVEASGDFGTIASRILELAQNEPLRKKMGAAGVDRVKQHFSEEAMLRRYEALHQEVLR